jgi:predicted nucleic acid-binding protein
VSVLLDTYVLADLCDPRGHLAVKAAVALLSDVDLYLSGLTLGEIAGRVLLVPDDRKKRNLRAWLTSLQDQFANRILTVDHETAILWGEMVLRAQRDGHKRDGESASGDCILPRTLYHDARYAALRGHGRIDRRSK